MSKIEHKVNGGYKQGQQQSSEVCCLSDSLVPVSVMVLGSSGVNVVLATCEGNLDAEMYGEVLRTWFC